MLLDPQAARLNERLFGLCRLPLESFEVQGEGMLYIRLAEMFLSNLVLIQLTWEGGVKVDFSVDFFDFLSKNLKETK